MNQLKAKFDALSPLYQGIIFGGIAFAFFFFFLILPQVSIGWGRSINGIGMTKIGYYVGGITAFPILLILSTLAGGALGFFGLFKVNAQMLKIGSWIALGCVALYLLILLVLMAKGVSLSIIGFILTSPIAAAWAILSLYTVGIIKK